MSQIIEMPYIQGVVSKVLVEKGQTIDPKEPIVEIILEDNSSEKILSPSFICKVNEIFCSVHDSLENGDKVIAVEKIRENFNFKKEMFNQSNDAQVYNSLDYIKQPKSNKDPHRQDYNQSSEYQNSSESHRQDYNQLSGYQDSSESHRQDYNQLSGYQDSSESHRQDNQLSGYQDSSESHRQDNQSSEYQNSSESHRQDNQSSGYQNSSKSHHQNSIELDSDIIKNAIKNKNKQKYAVILGTPSAGKSIAYTIMLSALNNTHTHDGQSTPSGSVIPYKFYTDADDDEKVFYDIAGEDFIHWLVKYAGVRTLETLEDITNFNIGSSNRDDIRYSFFENKNHSLSDDALKNLNNLILNASKVYVFVASQQDQRVKEFEQYINRLGINLTKIGKIKASKIHFIFNHVDEKFHNILSPELFIQNINDTSEIVRLIESYIQAEKEGLLFRDNNPDDKIIINTVQQYKSTTYKYAYLLYPSHLLIKQKLIEDGKNSNNCQDLFNSLEDPSLILDQNEELSEAYLQSIEKFKKDLLRIFDFNAQNLNFIERVTNFFDSLKKWIFLPIIIALLINIGLYYFIPKYSIIDDKLDDNDKENISFTLHEKLNGKANPYVSMSVNNLIKVYRSFVFDFEANSENIDYLKVPEEANNRIGKVCTCSSVLSTEKSVNRYEKAINGFYGLKGYEPDRYFYGDFEKIYENAPITNPDDDQEFCQGKSASNFFKTESTDVLIRANHKLDESLLKNKGIFNSIKSIVGVTENKNLPKVRNEIRECSVKLNDFWVERIKLAHALNDQADLKKVKDQIDKVLKIFEEVDKTQSVNYSYLAEYANIQDNIDRERPVLEALRNKNTWVSKIRNTFGLSEKGRTIDIHFDKNVEEGVDMKQRFLQNGYVNQYENYCDIPDSPKGVALLCNQVSQLRKERGANTKLLSQIDLIDRVNKQKLCEKEEYVKCSDNSTLKMILAIIFFFFIVWLLSKPTLWIQSKWITFKNRK